MERTPSLSFPRSRAILLVEDDYLTAEMLQQFILEETSFHVVIAKNSFEALECVKYFPFNLFIIDYLLPTMNGIELYDNLHAIEKLKDIPTIITSASLMLQRQKGLEERRLITLNKPFKLEELLITIQQVAV